MKYSYILVNLLTEFKFLPTTDVKRKILINSRVSDKIRKLANMQIIFNTGSDVMMTSFTTKKGTGTISLRVIITLIK